jgi:ABC-type multidrug transport system ATPase subunit
MLGITIEYEQNYAAWGKGGVGKQLTFMAAAGFVYWLLLFFSEWTDARQSSKTIKGETEAKGDDDVRREQDRVRNTGATHNTTDEIVVDLVSKVWGGGGCSRQKGKTAVDSVSFGIQAGECFGLLGVNGAGKTSTFEMLTGEVTMSSGSIHLKGLDITTKMAQIRQHIGYCPQYDGLVDTLTGRESLAMFARLRGVPEEKVDELVESSIKAMALSEFGDENCGTYSGGNKRKLSTAIAIVGAPDIIFLDEPTSGMDPKSRRYLWNVLLAIRKSGKIIVLTSHSMEECEALCSKVCIMKEGQLQCLGTPQHLKTKYGSGWAVSARLANTGGGIPPDTTAIKAALSAAFPDAVLEKDVFGEVGYTVEKGTPLSTIFSTLESVKVSLNIEDYSVTQTSLEQVFLKFAAAARVKGDDEEDAQRPEGNAIVLADNVPKQVSVSKITAV